jgi:histidinol-phosphate aminotransferase
MEEIARLCRPEIYALKPYSSARTEGTEIAASIFLDANESPYPPYPGGEPVAGLNRYPEPQPRVLLDRFADLFGVQRSALFLSRGADEAIDLLVRAFCRAGRDAILIAPPTFVMYETAAAIQGAGVFQVPLIQTDRFDLDVGGMLRTQAGNPAIKLVFVCSPNNPSANLMRRGDVLRLARELSGRSLVVVDELYVDYSGEPSLATEIAGHPNLVVLRSLSKEYGLAGERCGITVAHPETIRILGRIMPPYPLTTSAIRVIGAAVTADGLAYARANRLTVLDERRRVESALAGSPAVTRIFHSDANFLLLQLVEPGLFVELMAANGIKVRDRRSLVPDAVRLSIGTREENDTMLRVFAGYAERVAVAPARAAGPDPRPRHAQGWSVKR